MIRPAGENVDRRALGFVTLRDERILVPERKDKVYRAIKARAISYGFAQGRRILLGPLAEELDTSTHHVREALIRLVSEGWVDQLPNKGFQAVSLDLSMLADCYEFNQSLLVPVLDAATAGKPIQKDILARIESILEKLTSFKGTGESLATITGETFAAMGALGGNRVVMQYVEQCNEHLYFIRTLESQDLEGVSMELAGLCEMVVSRHFAELRQTIIEYHARRIQLLSKQIRFLAARHAAERGERGEWSSAAYRDRSYP